MKFMRVVALVLALFVAGTLSAACTIKRSNPLYKQCDGKWGSNGLGSSSTICKVGCLMSSVAMGMAGAGKTINGQTATPQTLNSYLKGHGGYQGNLFVWGAVEKFGLKYEGQTSNKSTIRSNICANKVVILNVKNGGHWVLATGFDGETFKVNDPGATRYTYPSGEVVRAAAYRL